MKFIKFPNGKIWRVTEEGVASGIVLVPGYDNMTNLEERLDAVAEAATGSFIGLEDFSVESRGGDFVAFTGLSREYLGVDWLAVQGEYKVIDPNSEEFSQALREQYGLSDIEIEHALDNLTTTYGDECSVDVLGSLRQLRCPPHPEPCSYVRVVVDGFETAYWVEDEWASAPAEVMGALIGALKRS